MMQKSFVFSIPRILFLGILLLSISPLGNCQIVINEIHYDPDVKTEFGEFIELYNADKSDINVSGWQF